MDITDLVKSVDILDYISQYTDFQERNGEFWGLSPLKDENTPSFSVNTDSQLFYDFSSGCGGDVLEFIQRYHKCGFKKAVSLLKKFAGTDENSHVRQIQCVSIMKKYNTHHKRKKESKAKKLPDDYMSRYDISEEMLSPWESEGISKETMEFFQVRYDPFSNRIVFPIRDVSGSIINVSGRTLDPDYKSKKTRKYTYFFPLGTLDTLYGLSENIQEIMDKKEIILFEGAKSVMLMRTWGYRNAAAILTSHLNESQFQILLRIGVRVVFALDYGVDIREDSQIMKLKRYLPVEWIRNMGNILKDKMAPVDAGRENWEFLYKNRIALR